MCIQLRPNKKYIIAKITELELKRGQEVSSIRLLNIRSDKRGVSGVESIW